jgi:hypothetical protein
MGSGLPLDTPCTGADVIGDLNDVFSQPNSNGYQSAKNASLALFQGVPQTTADNYKQLYVAYQAAYAAAGVTICPNWQPYLQSLGEVDPTQGPLNIYNIAQARYEGLNGGKKMKTKTHTPQGHHIVKVMHESDGSITIDSPYTPTYDYRRRR